jgi:hypothetical protein
MYRQVARMERKSPSTLAMTARRILRNRIRIFLSCGSRIRSVISKWQRASNAISIGIAIPGTAITIDAYRLERERERERLERRFPPFSKLLYLEILLFGLYPFSRVAGLLLSENSTGDGDLLELLSTCPNSTAFSRACSICTYGSLYTRSTSSTSSDLLPLIPWRVRSRSLLLYQCLSPLRLISSSAARNSKMACCINIIRVLTGCVFRARIVFVSILSCCAKIAPRATQSQTYTR